MISTPHNHTKHFACQQCGACCTQAPHILFSELKYQSKFFLLQTTHEAVISSSKNLLSKDMINHYETIGHTVMMPELEAAMFVTCGFIAIGLVSTGRCPKLLANGLCDIHPNRPGACASAPLSLDKPEALQYQSIEFYENRVQSGWKCDFSEQAPLILKDGHYSSLITQKMMTSQLREVRFFTNQWLGFIKQCDEKRLQEHFKLLYQAASSGKTLLTDLIFSLQLAVSGEALTGKEATDIMQEQLQHATNLEAEAMKKKDPLDRPATDLARRLQLDYRKALKQNIFEIETV